MIFQSVVVLFLTDDSWGILDKERLYPMSTLGERIKSARAGMSQEAFSRALGISKGALGFYERNENLPNTEVALKISLLAGVRLEWLLSGEGPRTPSENVEIRKSASETICSRCVRLEERLDRLEEERRTLVEENRQLWKENAELRERCARFEEREKQGGTSSFFKSSQERSVVDQKEKK